MAVRVAFVGVGGIGGWLATRMVEAAGKGGQAATAVLIARGPHGAAIREKGLRLRVRGSAGSHDVLLPTGGAEVYGSVEEAVSHRAQPVDFAVLGVKTWQVRQAATEVLPLLGASGCVVTTQNGVEAPGAAGEAVGFHRVLGGVAKVWAYLTSPGQVEMEATPSDFLFGEVFEEDGVETSSSSSERAERLAAVFAGCAGLNAQVPRASAWAMLWEKAIIMCAMGPVGALARAPTEQLLGIPETRELLRSAMREVAACAAAAGHLPEGQTPEVKADRLLVFVEEVVRGASGTTTSTLRDVCCGRQSELFELTGGIVRAGRALGVPTPTHDLILAALLPQELRARGDRPYALNGVPRGAPHVAN